jgi:hypothetical protein
VADATAPLRRSDRGLLSDLGAAGVMTTDQIRRLRFPGTGAANCRRHLAALARGGLIARLPLPGPGGHEACWHLTAAGRAAVGVTAPVPGIEALRDPWRLDDLLQAAEHYIQEALRARAEAAAEPTRADGP